MLISSNPIKVTEGETTVLITAVPNSVGNILYYGFGDDTPTNWHSYIARVNDPLVISPDFGPIWLKSGATSLNIVMSKAL